MTRRSNSNLVVLALAHGLLLGCVVDSADGSKKTRTILEKSEVVDIRGRVDEEKKGDPQNDYCRGFLLDSEQIKEFFRRAEIIQPETEHRMYDWTPCFVEGRFKLDNRYYEFEINAASTGAIFLSDDETVIFGCKEACKDLFDYGFY